MNKTISFVISTISDRINQIKLPSKIEGISYIIVHQKKEESKLDIDVRKLILRDDVKYLPDDGIGLSRSRNVGIENSESDYCYILDDDVKIVDGAINKLIELVNNIDVDVATFKVVLPDGSDFKRYSSRIKSLNIISAARVCSIEMLLRTSSIKKNKLKFNESFGLGARYPSGEEYIFLSDCFRKKLICVYFPYETVIHPPESSGDDFFTDRKKIIAKREMFKNITKKQISILSIAFFIKKIPILIKRKSLFSFAIFFFRSGNE